MKRGYSIYRKGKKGAFYVAWTDGDGKRKAMRAGESKDVAREIGQTKAAESSRVRAGVIRSAEMKAIEAGREPIAKHLDAWKKYMGSQQVTKKHVNQHHRRVQILMALAGVERLPDVRPEAITNALPRLKSPQLQRHYLGALRTFIKWCLQTHRLAEHPIMAVKMPKARGKVFKRYPFTHETLAKLLAATEKRDAKTPFEGKDRAIWYQTMAYTGIRKMESAALTPESFHLAGKSPFIAGEAAYSKNGKDYKIPLRLDFAAKLAAWLKGKPTGKPVFTLSKGYRCEEVFEADCKAAEIPPIPKDYRRGVHCLRRFFITNMVRGGGLAAARELARHSTPALTAEYADLEDDDFAKGLAALPPI